MTTTSSEDAARVAVWGINADEVEMNLFDSEYTANGAKVVKSNDGDKLIAPGTSMSSQFSIVTLDAIAPEVMYEIKINLDDSEIDPRILENPSIQWKLDDNEFGSWEQTKAAILGLSGHTSGVKTYAPGTIARDFANGKTHTIAWRWVMDNNNDVQDTELGNAATRGDITAKIGIKITARQVDRDTTGLLAGDGQSFNKVAPTPLSFISTASIDKFLNVTVDGEELDSSNYTVGDDDVTLPQIPFSTQSYITQGPSIENESLNYTFADGTFYVSMAELKAYGNYDNLSENSFVRIVLDEPIDIDDNFYVSFDLETSGVMEWDNPATNINAGIRLFDNTTGTTLANTIGYMEKHVPVNNGATTVKIYSSDGFDRSGNSTAYEVNSIGIYPNLYGAIQSAPNDGYVKISNVNIKYCLDTATSVTLKEDYLSTLSEGTHEIKINSDDTTSIASFEIIDGYVRIGSTSYPTLQSAISNATPGATIKLMADVEESVTIASNQNVIIDLNGYSISGEETSGTNLDANTVIDEYSAITNNGILTIKGNGTVDGRTDATSALFNKGTATLLGGTYLRSTNESIVPGTSYSGSSVNDYYTITNIGTLTINGENVVIESNSVRASSLANGWNNVPGTYDGTAGTLIVNAGTIQGGRHAITNNIGSTIIAGGSILAKAEGGKDALGIDGGTVTINGGTISSSDVAMTIEGTSVVTINGGEITGTINADTTATVTDNR